MISILIDIKIQELIEQETYLQKKINFRLCFAYFSQNVENFQHGIFFNPGQDGEDRTCSSGL